ncbi:MAG: class I SAM-dependent methyltransferase [Paracoccaceae bacterium]|nr:class I SAM-dependent methyltransferase [Paracoccaceae bacterium]
MQHETAPEAIGGWLKDADAGMIRQHRRLSDIGADALDPAHLAYFEDYRSRYFNDRLLPGQGVEEILATLSNHGGRPARWVDLGAGVTTLFWAIGVDRPAQVVACDLVPEALSVLSTFKQGDEVPRCYGEAMALLGRSLADFNSLRRSDWDFRVLDCLSPWTLTGFEEGFDLVTAIGCLGLAHDADHYAQAFLAGACNLRPGGRFIGADWVRSAAFVDIEGHDNGYVSASLTESCGERASLQLLSIENISIKGDPYYDSVLVWAFGV